MSAATATENGTNPKVSTRKRQQEEPSFGQALVAGGMLMTMVTTMVVGGAVGSIALLEYAHGIIHKPIAVHSQFKQWGKEHRQAIDNIVVSVQAALDSLPKVTVKELSEVAPKSEVLQDLQDGLAAKQVHLDEAAKCLETIQQGLKKQGNAPTREQTMELEQNYRACLSSSEAPSGPQMFPGA
jgi:hypothetical protein